MKIKQGKFIVFEGLDGSGQSTQANLLKDFLTKKGHQALLTKEPTLDSEAGKKIRKILDKKIRFRRGNCNSSLPKTEKSI